MQSALIETKLPNGFNALFMGFGLLTKPGIKRYAFIPILINIIIFGSGLYYAFGLIESVQMQFEAWLPDWLDFLSYLLWPLFILSAGVIVFYLFTTITQLIASPFNAILSEKVEKLLGLPVASEENPITFFQALKQALPREISKIIKSLKWILLMIILSFIPGLNILVPIIAGWLMCVDYLDFPADNRGMNFNQSLQHINKRRFHHLSFGVCVSIASIIPVINLFVVPAAVAGGTALWHGSKQA